FPLLSPGFRHDRRDNAFVLTPTGLRCGRDGGVSYGQIADCGRETSPCDFVLLFSPSFCCWGCPPSRARQTRHPRRRGCFFSPTTPPSPSDPGQPPPSIYASRITP